MLLPFIVSVPFELWCGDCGYFTPQCPVAAHGSLGALGFLYCWRICRVTQC